jgi:ABC-type Na+ transport system ATPase subunit NatA
VFVRVPWGQRCREDDIDQDDHIDAAYQLGHDITEYNDPTLLSICPEFNTHLCQELTPYEHFVLYSYLFQLLPVEAERETNRPIKDLKLEEPTASLDAVATHHVHEMIVDFKGEKVFMLCTHLLSESETLCDQISIMIKGCVYTVGSPAHLSAKFGTEFKVSTVYWTGR